MSAFSGIWKKDGSAFRAEDVSTDTFELDLEYAPEWSEEGEVVALAYQSVSEYFRFARFVGGRCARELEYSSDLGWTKAEGAPEPWEADVLARALARRETYEPQALAELERLAGGGCLLAGKQVPLINAQDTVLELMKIYDLPSR
jgi:hypothetical protein